MDTHNPPTMEPEKMTEARPRRRWYQFTLRTLLIVMTLASVGLSWFAVKLQQARRQRAAVEAIEKAGGWVEYDYELRTRPPSDADPPGPAWLRNLLGIDFFATVVEIRLPTTVTGAEAERIQQLLDECDPPSPQPTPPP